MTPFEQFAINRLVHCAGIYLTPEIESVLLMLLRSAKEGNFCCKFEGELPEALCENGGDDPCPSKPLVRQGNRLYFQKNWALETFTIQKVSEIWRRQVLPADLVQLSLALEREKTRLTKEQIEAVSKGFTKNLTIFSGGPGTGKTYTAAAFIRVLAATLDSCKVVITAPTGKAAAHLESVFQTNGAGEFSHLTWESMTLHRLLGLRPKTQRLASEYRIDADLVVVDEASMMDAYLLLHLLNGVGQGTRLLLLGDANQLPPVEGVSFFPEIAHHLGQKLTSSIRMGEGMVGKVSRAILEGKLSDIPRLPWIPKEDLLVDWLCKVLPSPYHSVNPNPLELLQELTHFRILSALRQGPFGVDSLNRQILAKFQTQNVSDWLAIPILVLQNNPTQELYNGTTGILIRKGGTGTAYFLSEGGVRTIPEKALPRYEVAFCLSIHKSQGSEFEEVLVLFGPGSERFGTRALYTAATRAKKKVEICAEEASFQAAFSAVEPLSSGFIERIAGLNG
jgi:exodeoxyribonuclease V alpha subunit